MSNNMSLAITSIPVQQWTEVYDENKAFRNGTIFPELNLPFYVTAQEMEKGGPDEYERSLNDQESMLFQIQKVGFVLDDLRLYLDTHPEDKEGLKLLKSLIRRKKRMMSEFAEKFYPLTPDCMADIYEKNPDSEYYCWQKGKIPWEGVSK